MSSISSTQAGQGLVQFLQSLSGGSSSSAAGASGTSAGSPTATSAITGSSATGKTKGHHHHGNTGGFEKLLQTVTTALQSAQSSGSTIDPNQTIESALEKIFKNGIAGSSTTAKTTSTANPADPNSGTISAPDADNAKQSFLDTLQSFGVTPHQFQQDLATALSQANANGGQVNPVTAFASFTPGTLLDTTA